MCLVDTQGSVLGRRPHCQPAVDCHDDQVLEELGGDHHKDHEAAARGQVAPAHLGEGGGAERLIGRWTLVRVDGGRKGRSLGANLPWNLGSSAGGRGHVVVFLLLLFFL